MGSGRSAGFSPVHRALRGVARYFLAYHSGSALKRRKRLVITQILMNKSFSFVVIQSSSCCLRYDDVASVPPHPNPLPRGEGTACDASPDSEWQPSCERPTVLEESRRMLPLPKGEGWGEGEQHDRSRCARNVRIRFPHPAKMWLMTRHERRARFLGGRQSLSYAIWETL